jgi:hypothetical protein
MAARGGRSPRAGPKARQRGRQRPWLSRCASSIEKNRAFSLTNRDDNRSKSLAPRRMMSTGCSSAVHQPGYAQPARWTRLGWFHSLRDIGNRRAGRLIRGVSVSRNRGRRLRWSERGVARSTSRMPRFVGGIRRRCVRHQQPTGLQPRVIRRRCRGSRLSAGGSTRIRSNWAAPRRRARRRLHHSPPPRSAAGSRRSAPARGRAQNNANSAPG